MYLLALETLGVKDFEPRPDGAADDRITFEVFLTEAYVSFFMFS